MINYQKQLSGTIRRRFSVKNNYRGANDARKNDENNCREGFDGSFRLKTTVGDQLTSVRRMKTTVGSNLQLVSVAC
jgi:hypothetical protein